MSSIQTSLLNLVLAFMLIVSGHIDVRADDCEGISCSCSRGASTSTCPDGSTIDSCDDCPSSSGGSSGGNGNPGAGMIKLVGGLIGVAIFVPGFVISPVVAIEVFWSLWANQHPLGDRTAQIAAAKEKWEAFDTNRKDLEARGHEINVAKLEIDKSDLKDALKQQDFPPLDTPPPPNFWWQRMPRLVPNLDIACKAAGLEFPFRILPGERIGIFTDRVDMLTRCGSRIDNFALTAASNADGTCANANDRRCLQSGVCCPQGFGVHNPIDGHCYRDTDYRRSDGGDEAERYLGGEYCASP